MKLKELVNNEMFDLNCNYAVYECPKEGTCWETGTRVFTTAKDFCPPEEILQKEIKYITEHSHFLIIEVR